MSADIILWILGPALILAGLAGTVFPALPGVPLVFCGIVAIAWIDDFATIGALSLWLCGALTVVALIIDFAAAALGTRRTDASPRAFWGATLGAIAGIFFGLPGMIIGPFIGALAMELTTGRGLGQAGKAGAGAWLGILIGTAAKLAIAFLMIGIVVFARLIN